MTVRNPRNGALFTKGLERTELIYKTDPEEWVEVTLTLATVGPVAWGWLNDMSPTVGGKGDLLQVGVPTKIIVPPSQQLQVVSTSVNRVGYDITPYPYLESIDRKLGANGAAVGAKDPTSAKPPVPPVRGRTTPQSPPGSNKIPKF